MSIKKFFSGLAVVVLWAFAPLAAQASAGGAVYLDLTGLATYLQTETTGFAGWQYQSAGKAISGGVQDGQSLAAPDLLASVGGTQVAMHAGNLMIEAGQGGTSQSYQTLTATIQLAAGQHFIYRVPYTMTMHTSFAQERVDVGVGFRIEDAVGENTVDKTWSTLDWKVPVGTSSESNILEIDLYNSGQATNSYTLTGWLGAASASQGSVVPEPATYLMLLSGLAALGVAARRIRADRA